MKFKNREDTKASELAGGHGFREITLVALHTPGRVLETVSIVYS